MDAPDVNMPVTIKKYIILVQSTSREYEAWNDLKNCCLAHGWNYHTLSKKELPTQTRDGCRIFRVQV